MLLDSAESAFADRANIRVHLASCNAENPERHGERTTDRDRHAHLIPAASADTGTVANGLGHQDIPVGQFHVALADGTGAAA